MKHLFFLAFSFIFSLTTYTQNAPFNLAIEAVSIPQLGGLQSFAFGQADGKWLLVGGRLDGLHRRQPFASFDQAGHNNQLIVVDPIALQTWSAPLSALPVSMQEQLSSTNMNFIQDGNNLYCIGGYGYSASLVDHVTYDKLTAIDVAGVIDAIVNNTAYANFFRQITDAQFQVTGGRLRKIYDVYHLLGGQKFMGRYNPMNNPTFTQEYTNQVRRFTLEDDGVSLNVTHLTAHTSATDLHRRDYNAEPQIFPNGEEGVTLFSGVFQPTADLPFLNAVSVDSSSFAVEPGFEQYYNHYHCPALPLYSEAENEMHTVFFGGIAQYYDSNGVLVQDNNVPFVNTIARVTRDANGNMSEHKLPIEMPALLGAGAEFILNKELPSYPNHVLKLDELNADTTLLGYIFGGINSTAPNIFWINDGSQSTAHHELFKVYLINTQPNALHEKNEESTNTLQFRVFPNPSEGAISISFHLNEKSAVQLTVSNSRGVLLSEQILGNSKLGLNELTTQIETNKSDGIFFLTLKTETKSATRKLILKR